MDPHQLILERCPDAVYLFDLGTLSNRYANRSVFELVGWSAAELETFGPRLMDEILHPEDRARVASYWERLRDAPDDRQSVIRYRMKSPAGDFRWLESREVPFERDGHGRVTVILGVASDATGRLEEEARLRASEERFRLLAENARELICLHHPDGRFRYVSPAVREILGYQPEELRSVHPMELVHPDDATRVRGDLVDAGQGPGAIPHAVRYRARSAGGEFKELETTTVPLVVDDELQGLQTVSRDVTVQRRLEERMQATQRLEVVGQLAAGVAHDFNNVLTAVRVSLELLVEESRPGERASLLGEALEAVERAGLLTRRLLAAGRRDRSRRAPLELGATTAEVLALVERLLSLSVRFRPPPEPLWALLDAGAIEQVLLNLVINARDADAGETIEVRLHAEERSGADAVVLSVRDRGPGIPEALRERVFEPFFTTKGEGQGTGLGLATVRALVEGNDGSVILESREGEGTEVRCAFPRIPPPTDGKPAPRGRSPASCRSVLVVDDEPGVRRALARILESAGFRVEAAADGEEALERLRRGPLPDLVVTDVFMPRLDGPGLVAQARAEGLCPRAIFVTGYVPGGPLLDRVASLGDPLLHKPFPAEELIRAVAERLRTAAPASPTG